MIINIVFQVEYDKTKGFESITYSFCMLANGLCKYQKHDLEADLKRQTIAILIGNTVKPRQ